MRADLARALAVAEGALADATASKEALEIVASAHAAAEADLAASRSEATAARIMMRDALDQARDAAKEVRRHDKDGLVVKPLLQGDLAEQEAAPKPDPDEA